MKKHCLPILVPCHRVVKSGSGDVGNYSGGEGTATKKWLLEHERKMISSDSWEDHVPLYSLQPLKAQGYYAIIHCQTIYTTNQSTTCTIMEICEAIMSILLQCHVRGSTCHVKIALYSAFTVFLLHLTNLCLYMPCIHLWPIHANLTWFVWMLIMNYVDCNVTCTCMEVDHELYRL